MLKKTLYFVRQLSLACALLITSITLLFSSACYAQDNSDTFTAFLQWLMQQGASTGNAIDNLVNGYGQNAANQYLWIAPYDISALESASSNVQPLLFLAPLQQAQTLTAQGVINTLTTTSNNYDTTVTTTVSRIPAPLTPIPLITSSGKQVPNPTLLAAAQQSSMNFDINNLIGTMQYDAGNTASNPPTPPPPGPQQVAAQNFITLVSGQANPMKVVDFSKLNSSQLSMALSDSDVAAYLAAIRTYTAQQAVGLSNLYAIYAERLPNNSNNISVSSLVPPITQQGQNDVPPPKNYTPPSIPSNASPLQIRNFLATRRINDAYWYTRMGVASPAEVQRQTLFLLAEMRAEQFNEEMILEHLNATLSVLVMQNAAAQTVLLQQGAKTVQTTVDQFASGPSH